MLAGLAVAGMLSACGSKGDAAPDAAFNVSFANATEGVPIFRSIHTTTDSLVKKDGGVSVKWYDNDFDPSKMLSNARLMVQDHPDALVVYPVSTDSQGLANLLGRSDAPCVSINAPTPGCLTLHPNVENAANVAKLMGDAAKAKGWSAENTTLLLGQNAAAGETGNLAVQSFYPAIAPIMGYKEISADQIKASMTKFDDNVIQFDGKSALQPAYDAVKAVLASVPKDHHILLFTLNDESTIGALRAIDAGGVKKDVIVAGVGASPTALKNLREDERWIAESDILAPFWGTFAIAAGQQLASGEKAGSDKITLPSITLTKDNVDTYYPGDATLAVQLPPMTGDASFLKDAPFLKSIGNAE